LSCRCIFLWYFELILILYTKKNPHWSFIIRDVKLVLVCPHYNWFRFINFDDVIGSFDCHFKIMHSMYILSLYNTYKTIFLHNGPGILEFNQYLSCRCVFLWYFELILILYTKKNPHFCVLLFLLSPSVHTTTVLFSYF
jgi:hypothetical protein